MKEAKNVMGIDFVANTNVVAFDLDDSCEPTKEAVAIKVVQQLVRMGYITPVYCRDDNGKQLFVIK